MIENGILAFSRVFIIYYYIKGEPHHEHRAADLTEQTPVGLYTSIYINIYGVFETRRRKSDMIGLLRFHRLCNMKFRSPCVYVYTRYYSTTVARVKYIILIRE